LHFAVVAARGLGDGLLSMILTHNLCRAGHTVTCFSTPLCQLRAWFPGHDLQPFPTPEQYTSVFSQFDRLIVADYACLTDKHHVGCDMLILKEKILDRQRTMVANLVEVCRTHLGLKDVIPHNGIAPLPHLIPHKFPKRVILHPMSTSEDKNWPAHNFIKLYNKLQNTGLEPILCVSPQERPFWEHHLDRTSLSLPYFPRLEDLASFVYESGSMIGNDSGVGHLASCLGLPTLSLFARKSHAALWRPGWSPGTVLAAPPYLIGSRLKQKLWKIMIRPQTVAKTFQNFLQKIS